MQGNIYYALLTNWLTYWFHRLYACVFVVVVVVVVGGGGGGELGVVFVVLKILNI